MCRLTFRTSYAAFGIVLYFITTERLKWASAAELSVRLAAGIISAKLTFTLKSLTLIPVNQFLKGR
jgi:hypothetical protein